MKEKLKKTQQDSSNNLDGLFAFPATEQKKTPPPPHITDPAFRQWLCAVSWFPCLFGRIA